MNNLIKNYGIFLGFALAFLGACLAYFVVGYPLAIGSGVVGAAISTYSAAQNGLFSGK